MSSVIVVTSPSILQSCFTNMTFRWALASLAGMKLIRSTPMCPEVVFRWPMARVVGVTTVVGGVVSAVVVSIIIRTIAVSTIILI